MSEATGVYRTTHSSGMEVAFIDKGVGNPIGIPRERYESNGYKPAFDELPQK
ncbi:hypothetical protein [Vannielia litorea]|uniref:hypothetical protein n=1 Tax=Vannielia litorea TaxID=1217970 RepID=UPI001BCF731C|nr:hypothetical protein [Vannielia litorea]